jgi:hypothetical protein
MYVMAYALVSENIPSIIGRLGRLIRFFGGLLGVTTEMFLSMISSAAHPRCPLWPPSLIWYSIYYRTNAWVG